MPEILNVAHALVLILLCSLLSLWQDHGLSRDLWIGSARTIIQLALLGQVLTWIFQNSSLIITLVVASIMTLNAAFHSGRRSQAKYKGVFLDALMATTLPIWPLAFFGSILFQARPFWQVEVVLPLLGMMLGNTMNGISVGVNHFVHEVQDRKDNVLSWIALGATTSEATKPVFQRSLRIAMTPTLNTMATIGIVSIPGMMTGQILAGNSPTNAAVAQAIIMLMITSGAYLGTFLGLLFSRRRLFNRQGQPCF